MPDINSITAGNSYVGNAALGGFAPTAIDLDVKPIQQLAQYTFLYNKSQYDQKQKDADEKIAKLAELAPYDLVNGEGKDAEIVLDNLKKLRERGAQFAATNWKTPDEKDRAYFAFQKDIAGYKDVINSANKRAIAYDLEKSRINQQDIPPEAKKIQVQDLDKQFNSTNVFTPITSTAKVEVPDIVVAPPVMKTTQRVVVTPNGDVTETENLFSPAQNRANANAEEFGLYQPPLPNNATDEQKRQYQINAAGNKRNEFWQTMGANYNAALLDPKYSKTQTDPVTGLQVQINEVDLNKVKSNPLIQGQVDLINRYNTWAAQKKQDVLDGKYKDYIDPKTNLLVNITADEFNPIDPTKPLQPSDLIFLEKFRQAAPDKLAKEYKYTGDATKRENAWLDYKASLAHLPQNKPPEVIEKPAQLFGQHIERLKLTFSKNGNKSITVQGKAVDDKTKIAAKMDNSDEITYNPDGGYIVTDNKGKVKSTGTIENLAQGFIDAVKVVDLSGGVDKDGTMAEGFQTKSENMFNKVFGTTSGKVIWDNWGGNQSAPAQQNVAPRQDATTISVNDVPAGTKLTQKRGKYYYNGKEVIQ